MNKRPDSEAVRGVLAIVALAIVCWTILKALDIDPGDKPWDLALLGMGGVLGWIGKTLWNEKEPTQVFTTLESTQPPLLPPAYSESTGGPSLIPPPMQPFGPDLDEDDDDGETVPEDTLRGRNVQESAESGVKPPGTANPARVSTPAVYPLPDRAVGTATPVGQD